LISLGTYLPPWQLGNRRVKGPDEDALTMAVGVGLGQIERAVGGGQGITGHPDPLAGKVRDQVVEAAVEPTDQVVLGTLTSEKNNSAVSAENWPILSSLRPRVKPSMPSSIISRLMPLCRA
jgi:hypothetical protein